LGGAGVKEGGRAGPVCGEAMQGVEPQGIVGGRFRRRKVATHEKRLV